MQPPSAKQPVIKVMMMMNKIIITIIIIVMITSRIKSRIINKQNVSAKISRM